MGCWNLISGKMINLYTENDDYECNDDDNCDE